MSEEIDLATPEVDVDAVTEETSSDGVTPSEEAKPEEPFLSVNERTVYKTREDAARGYNEAASRIAQLSGWEKQAKQYGLSDPKQLEAVANELLALRKEKADAAAKLNAAPAKSDPTDPKAKEAQQVRDYLKANGFISKEDQDAVLKELRDEIAGLKQSGTRSEEVRFQNQETEARDNLKDWLSTSGIKDDANGTKAQVVGTLVKDWINNDDERVERWSRGGVSAKTLVKEGYDFALRALDWKGTPQAAAPGKPTDATYAASKAKALAANRKLPAPGTAKADGSGNRPAPKKGGAINTAMHEKAWELFQKLESK
jgi:hypothetical protein